MRKNKFLNKLKREGKLEFVECSEEICDSYLEKADNCLISAKILFKNYLYENSVSMSYYAMYNSLVALLFKSGIKSENHNASILLLKLLYNNKELFNIISKAKKERIDKQYYITDEEVDITKESTQQLVSDAEDFLLKMKLIIKKIKNKEIDGLREDFIRVIG